MRLTVLDANFIGRGKSQVLSLSRSNSEKSRSSTHSVLSGGRFIPAALLSCRCVLITPESCRSFSLRPFSCFHRKPFFSWATRLGTPSVLEQGFSPTHSPLSQPNSTTALSGICVCIH